MTAQSVCFLIIAVRIAPLTHDASGGCDEQLLSLTKAQDDMNKPRKNHVHGSLQLDLDLLTPVQ